MSINVTAEPDTDTPDVVLTIVRKQQSLDPPNSSDHFLLEYQITGEFEWDQTERLYLKSGEMKLTDLYLHPDMSVDRQDYLRRKMPINLVVS